MSSDDQKKDIPTSSGAEESRIQARRLFDNTSDESDVSLDNDGENLQKATFFKKFVWKISVSHWNFSFFFENSNPPRILDKTGAETDGSSSSRGCLKNDRSRKDHASSASARAIRAPQQVNTEIFTKKRLKNYVSVIFEHWSRKSQHFWLLWKAIIDFWLPNIFRTFES